VDVSTVTAHSLEWYENPGYLSKQTVDESRIAPENRIPRVTSATWKYESGAVGSFIHVVALQGHDYSCELEVYADGYQFKYVIFSLYARSRWCSHFVLRATGLSIHMCSQYSTSAALALI
jgi:putative oxidoreductase-like protein